MPVAAYAIIRKIGIPPNGAKYVSGAKLATASKPPTLSISRGIAMANVRHINTNWIVSVIATAQSPPHSV